jgi:hypothetical protein
MTCPRFNLLLASHDEKSEPAISNLPYDFGKWAGRKITGGAGSGKWYRFDKKATTGECHGVDVRYLHREGSLKPGRRFSLR